MSDENWVRSDEWWVTRIEWGVMSDEKKKTKQPLKLSLPVYTLAFVLPHLISDWYLLSLFPLTLFLLFYNCMVPHSKSTLSCLPLTLELATPWSSSISTPSKFSSTLSLSLSLSLTHTMRSEEIRFNWSRKLLALVCISLMHTPKARA